MDPEPGVGTIGGKGEDEGRGVGTWLVSLSSAPVEAAAGIYEGGTAATSLVLGGDKVTTGAFPFSQEAVFFM